MPDLRQGSIWWADLGTPIGSEAAYHRPIAVVQNDDLNSSAIRTVIICPLTTNLRLARSPGNVLLQAGEAGLTDTSVVNASAVTTINKFQRIEPVGHLSRARLLDILNGIAIVLRP